ncbi:inositol-trisphosphate 3-kinase A isoform X2 [Diachasma alloeum]|uniref:inositol-trisphosphate 3-kinase A isoform X2 n=1 Tax=Diachasma alloeum TaxID=454923 RepID=UPI0010FB6FD0|nr:inositol-trisphosphate 3-kinase A isoform X2 [Diachasma alloeum]
MQDTERIIPTIVCTKASFNDCGSHHEDDSAGDKRMMKQRRIARPRVRRNSRRLSITIDRHSSSSRSPSPIPHPRVDKIQGTIGKAQRPKASLGAQSVMNGDWGKCSGYRQYAQLLDVPQVFSSSIEWGEPSGDDLSSEWESDQSDGKSIAVGSDCCLPKSSGWRKLRNIVQWTPFFQTYKKHRYPWVQLAGHQGNFRAGPTPGTILKKLCPQEEACFRLLMHDVLRPYVPEFKGVLDVRESEEDRSSQEPEAPPKDPEDSPQSPIVASYLQLQDLLGDFDQPCVMDCKVGVRTYLESELAKAKERPKLRKDMYEKMIQVDPSAPSPEERRLQGVTKPRYMVWRETISSTATLGFRVEGIKLSHGGSSKDFKTTRTREQVTEALKKFVEDYPHAVPKYLQRLKAIRATLKASPFFASHEVVGSSLLFVHDAQNAGVWMIDFAKTLPLPSHLHKIRHDAEWEVGNHEDGYLIGVNNIIDIFEDIRNSVP